MNQLNNLNRHYETVMTPLGPVTVLADEKAVYRVFYRGYDEAHPSKLTHQAATWITSYFEGSQKKPDFPFRLSGTPFQKRVWETAASIPYGKTASYKTIAQMAGSPKAARAVGQAMRRNSLPLVIPCHRVICANGNPGGYDGNQINRKIWLLHLEEKGKS